MYNPNSMEKWDDGIWYSCNPDENYEADYLEYVEGHYKANIVRLGVNSFKLEVSAGRYLMKREQYANVDNAKTVAINFIEEMDSISD